MRDGAMAFKQPSDRINYEPNRYQHTPKEDPAYKDVPQPVRGTVSREKIDKPNDFGQAGQVFRKYSPEVRSS